MLELQDWRRTAAFPLATDQHGWVRVNLVGREARGSLGEADYEGTCSRIEARLRGLRSHDGRPVVADVLRTTAPGDDPAHGLLPDLVVHWTEAVFACEPVDVGGDTSPSPHPHAEQTGQHADGGFCVAAGPGAAHLPGVVDAESFGALLLDACSM